MYSISTSSNSYVVRHNNPQNIETQKQRSSLHQNSYVVELSANHIPTEIQEKPMLLLIDNLKTTDSKSKSESLIDKIKVKSKELANNIEWMRDTYFTIENNGTDDVYGRMSDGYTDTDRDAYIRALVHYQQCDNKLKSLINDPNFSMKKELTPHHSGQVHGDWVALEKLIEGKKAKLPDLTYNCSDLQCG